jgi:hypothetical protein
MSEVAQQISSLKIATTPIETLYLNEDRAHEHFLAQLGSIKEMMWAADRKAKGSFGVKILGAGPTVGGELSSDRSVTFDLTDRTGQILVLRYALEERKAIVPADVAAMGQYVMTSGAISLQRGADSIRSQAFEGTDSTMEELEYERQQVEMVDHMTGGPADSKMWLLALSSAGRLTGAGIINDRWLKTGNLASYRDWPSSMFGTVRTRVGGVPLITVLHVWADLRQPS